MLKRIIKADSMLFYDGDTLVLSMTEKEMDKDVHIAFEGELRSDASHHIQDELERISITVETLQLWSEKMLANGMIDAEQYKLRKNK